MRIVHVGPASDAPVGHRFGGAVQRRIWEMARCQARTGHQVVVYSFGPETRTAVVEQVGVRYFRCTTSHPLRQLELQARVVLDLRSFNEETDVIHFHGQPEGAALATGLARTVALSFDYFEFRGGRSGLAGGLYRNLLQRFDLLLPCSDYCRVESARHWGISPERMRVLFNGVNLGQFKPDRAGGDRERAAAGLQDEPAILYVGRVCEQKGSRVLVDAYRLLRKRGSRARLVVAGPVGQFASDGGAEWKSLLADAGAVYLGAVDEARLVGVYNVAEVFVMPTLSHEMFGMAAVEAQACGVPVIATDHGGLRETVPDGCGLRVATGDPQALADGIERLLADGALRASLARNAQANAARFSWENTCRRFEELLNEVRAGTDARTV